MSEKFLLPGGEEVGTGLQAMDDSEINVSSTYNVYGEEFFLELKDIEKLLKGDVYKTYRRIRSPMVLNQGNLGQCFPGDTLIRMADGSQKEIENISTLDEVLTAEGNQKTVVKTMVRRFSGDLVRVCVWGNRTLTCTPEHPILTKSGYKQAVDLTRDDWVAIPRFAPDQTTEVFTDSLIDKPVGVKGQKVYKQSTGFVYKKIPGKSESFEHRVGLPETLSLDYDFGWLLGLFLAEGTLNYSKTKFCLARHEETTLAANLIRIAQEKFGLSLTKVVRNNECQVKWYGNLWTRMFSKLCGYGVEDKGLHPIVTSGNRKFLEGILKGWIDGDGIGCQSRGLLGGVTVSKKLALNMYDIATYLGYHPTLEWLDPNINPKHNIKTRRRRYIVKWVIDPKGEQNPRYEQTENYVWRRVDKTEREAFSGWVHNFEVEDDHSYVAEGIGVHNCNASATTNAFHNMRQLDGLAHIPLCSNYIYMNINRGVDGGSQLIHGLEFAAKGVAPRMLNVDGKEVMFPHNVFNKRSVDIRLLQAADAAAPTFQSWEAFRLPTDSYATFRVALASALARGHQVVHAWHVGNNSMDLRNGYVVQGNGPGNHATLFHSARWVGGEDIVHPDCENSWGPSKHIHYGTVSRSGWGEDGFGLFTMADAYKCAKNHVFWVFPGNKVIGV
jgi:hypothetical protein